MKSSLVILTVSILTSAAFAEQPITTSTLDSLHLPFTLEALISRLEYKLVKVDTMLAMQKTLQITRAYYSYQTAKQELQLLIIERNNLFSIYNLNLKKQKQAAIDDEELFQSHNNYIQKEIQLLKKRDECRTSIIDLLELCSIPIRVK